MSFIPHTEADVQEMLNVVGVDNIDALFDEIPAELRIDRIPNTPEGINEMAMLRLMAERASQDHTGLCFLGAGSYDHHIPAAVWDIAGRGEFLTSYTPYQAEASQGTLQLLYEFQTMLASLTGMEVANASVYDGATALVESILMAARLRRKQSDFKVLLSSSIHPEYRATVETINRGLNLELGQLPISDKGIVDPDTCDFNDASVVVVQQPNFFGQLESVNELTDAAHQAGALVIGVVNPISLALLKPPGHWGQSGADIACGDGQPLGIPMASGGPSFGFLCSRLSSVRQLPGRIAGKTTDQRGNVGYVLTLQAREQHIRREKATSNICTNQGLLATAGTIYMTLMGPTGLREVAETCLSNTHSLVDRLTELPGISRRFSGPFFHECVLDLDRSAQDVQMAMLNQGVLAGLPLVGRLQEGGRSLLVCATEKRTQADIDTFVAAYGRV